VLILVIYHVVVVPNILKLYTTIHNITFPKLNFELKTVLKYYIRIRLLKIENLKAVFYYPKYFVMFVSLSTHSISDDRTSPGNS